MQVPTVFATEQPWFPYRLTGAIMALTFTMIETLPWFPYRLTGAIIKKFRG